MGNSFVLFEVSLEISTKQFHHGKIGHTQKVASSWEQLLAYAMGKIAGNSLPNFCRSANAEKQLLSNTLPSCNKK